MCRSDLEKIHNRSLIQVAGEIIDLQYLVQLVCVFFCWVFISFFSFLPIHGVPMRFVHVGLLFLFMTVSIMQLGYDVDVVVLSQFHRPLSSPLGDCAVGVWLLFDMVPGINTSFV